MIHLIAYLSILTLAVSRQVSKMTELPENYMTLNKGKKKKSRVFILGGNGFSTFRWKQVSLATNAFYTFNNDSNVVVFNYLIVQRSYCRLYLLIYIFGTLQLLWNSTHSKYILAHFTHNFSKVMHTVCRHYVAKDVSE